MVYLIYHGVVPIKAFKIMEFVRKGKASKDPATWAEHKQTMIDANIPDWFINNDSSTIWGNIENSSCASMVEFMRHSFMN